MDKNPQDPPPSYTPNTQPGQPGQTQPPAYGFQPLPQPYMPSSVTVATHSGMQPMNTSTIIYSTTPMAPMTSPPSDYLVLSIITTIFCCFWIGIAAILKSNETRGRIARGDRAGAAASSRTARLINIANIIAGLCLWGGIAAYVAIKVNSFYYYDPYDIYDTDDIFYDG